MTRTTLSSWHSHGQGQELLPCSNTPPAPLLLQQTPPEPLHLHGCSVSPAATSATQPGRGGHGGAAGGGSTRGPALPRPWESPALAAAVPLRSRDEKKNNSRGFPSPPVLAPAPAPPALSSPSASGSFISARRCESLPSPQPASALGPTLPGPNGRSPGRSCKAQLAGKALLAGKEDRSPLSPLQSPAECSGLPKSGCSHVPAEKSRHRDSV